MILHPSNRGAHKGEILSGDWSKYNDFIFLTSGVDGTIKIWDQRFLSRGPMTEIPKAHDYAIRTCKFSPHEPWTFGSTSYDMTMKLWDMGTTSPATGGGGGAMRGGNGGPVIQRLTYSEHTEFVFGLDWNLHRRGEVATCGWDEEVHVFLTPI